MTNKQRETEEQEKTETSIKRNTMKDSIEFEVVQTPNEQDLRHSNSQKRNQFYHVQALHTWRKNNQTTLTESPFNPSTQNPSKLIFPKQKSSN